MLGNANRAASLRMMQNGLEMMPQAPAPLRIRSVEALTGTWIDTRDTFVA